MNATLEKKDCSILITDDDESCRDTLREIVELQGFHTLLASCGEEAIDIVRSGVVHLALFDMNMPTMTGLEVLQVVRQFNAQLPAILVTGDPNENVVRQAYQQHVYSVIPKPISKNVVLYTVLRALTRFYGLVLQACEQTKDKTGSPRESINQRECKPAEAPVPDRKPDSHTEE